MENIYLELPDFIHGGNQDGIHILGPGRFLILRNIQGSTGDDFIAINADEEFLGEKIFSIRVLRWALSPMWWLIRSWLMMRHRYFAFYPVRALSIAYPSGMFAEITAVLVFI